MKSIDVKVKQTNQSSSSSFESQPMASLVLRFLTLIIAVLFLFLGHVKITDQFFPDQHAYAKNEFGKFNKEFPFHRQTGWRPYAKNYRLAVGIVEVICGVFLLLGVFQTLSTIALLTIITTGIITMQKLNYPLEQIVSLIGVSFLLVLRLLIASRLEPAATAKRPKSKAQ